MHAKQWTLEELHSLPDDGNKYELVRGGLFVTPAPTDEFETVLARLSRILNPYVAAHGLGMVYHPPAVMRFEGSEVEPDLMVRRPHPNPRGGWDTAPTPCLIVEVLTDSTRRRDQTQTRQLYLDAGVPEYWIVDFERAEVRVVRAGVDDDIASGQLVWAPAGAAEAMRIDLESVFGQNRSSSPWPVDRR
jgi:Uma2 family endonuclease